MSLSPIDLPSLVTHRIFSFFDYKSLKTARQVCKTWHLFLEQNRSLVKRFIEIESPDDLNSRVPKNAWDRKFVEENLYQWNALAVHVLEEGTIADIICLINMINMNETSGRFCHSRGNLWYLDLKTACFAPWKMGIGKVWKYYFFRMICSLTVSSLRSLINGNTR